MAIFEAAARRGGSRLTHGGVIGRLHSSLCRAPSSLPCAKRLSAAGAKLVLAGP